MVVVMILSNSEFQRFEKCFVPYSISMLFCDSCSFTLAFDFFSTIKVLQKRRASFINTICLHNDRKNYLQVWDSSMGAD